MNQAPPDDPGAVLTRPVHLPETPLVTHAAPGRSPAEWDAGHAVTTLYGTHYHSLVRLAALLTGNVATAEEAVQDSFAALHTSWPRLRDPGKALSYLRQSVVHRTRSAPRHRAVASRNAPQPPRAPSTGQGAVASLERCEVVSALGRLPVRQREALVLRYYCDLTEAQIASAMGISKGAVKSHTARGMSSLRTILKTGPG